MNNCGSHQTVQLTLLRTACDSYGLLGCYAYSPPDRHGRAAARMFAPSIGVPEDIANSTPCLAAHAAGFGTHRLTVDMGDHLGSPSTITATAHRDRTGHRIRVGGQATIVRTVRRGGLRAQGDSAGPQQVKQVL
ncbi:PhzF family phenazine biosynthesis protein [Streptomyces sp. NPDC048643]|uniref:PhzF family phenazine biosynthesis protein n=1 Tax=Streptomyces sp. NPDC048643 TaxID=3155637 RepID=UPI0034164810